MKKDILLTNEKSRALYETVRDLPIYDYHCHLSPKEIYEDIQFESIGEMWLKFDHYKWRMMRNFGIPEDYITGSASYEDKFIKYAEALSLSPGNPLYVWSHMELEKYFGITDTLSLSNARDIYRKANEYIRENKLSPRKIIKSAGVKLICTTDDICDDLGYHKLIKADTTFDTAVIPSFRTDNVFLFEADDYKSYLSKLENASGVKITSLSELKLAIEKRLEFFIENGCRYADIGIECFPESFCGDEIANGIFASLLSGENVSQSDLSSLRGNLIVYISKMYAKYGITSQIHFSVRRNTNRVLYKEIGTDIGTDCINDSFDTTPLYKLFNAVGKNPKTIVYTLNPSMIPALTTLCGSFENVTVGAAWWFCDTKSGIRQTLETVAELSSLYTFNGMLTDSRSFLSYARHDYYRRIVCSLIGEWIENGEYPDEESANLLLKHLCTR